jgi:16S rRNA processing protein RimM
LSQSSVNQTAQNTWAAVAVLLRPQGRRGELLADLLTDLPELFAAGRSVWVATEAADTPPADAAPLTIEAHWFPTGRNAGRIVLKLSGCDTISAAEQLAHHQLFVPASDLPALEAGAFFVGDLIGCQLFNGETLAGTITAVEFATNTDGQRLEDAAPLLAVGLPNAAPSGSEESPEPTLVPFVRDWIVSIDLAAKRIVMRLPEGLLIAEDE